tara:strand:+ start:314 stop:1600 length:1287 start_codon:yes stop_codon:yes gene_type:complete
MQVTLEETSSLGRKLTITVPSDKIQSEVSKRLNSLKGTIKVDGFRPGKVPLTIVRQRHGDRVQQEVIMQEMQTAYQEAVVQEQLNPASSPQIEPKEIAPGEDIVFVASLDIVPEFELVDFSECEVSLDSADVEEQNIDDAQLRIQKQSMDWQEAETEAEQGQRVTIDFVGRLDGEEFEGGKAEDFSMILGESNMIEGFEAPIYGMKTGDKKTFTVQFPEDYSNEKLAGKDTEFDVELKKLEVGTLPDIDQEFLTKLGVSGPVESFRDEIKSSLEGEVKRQVLTQSKQAVMQLLLEKHEIELPESMVQQEIATLREQASKNYKVEGETQLGDDLFIDEAKQRVKLGLLISQIVQKNKIQVDASRVNSHIYELARQYSDSEEVVKYYTTNNQARAQIESLVMEDQVVETIIGQVKVVENKVAFEDIVKSR